jgi:hypothetical protein
MRALLVILLAAVLALAPAALCAAESAEVAECEALVYETLRPLAGLPVSHAINLLFRLCADTTTTPALPLLRRYPGSVPVAIVLYALEDGTTTDEPFTYLSLDPKRLTEACRGRTAPAQSA